MAHERFAKGQQAAQEESPQLPDTLSPAIERIVQHWTGLVQSAARRYGLPGVDELTQDLRIRIWRALSRGGENPKTVGSSYVYQAVMSAAIDLLRRRRLDSAAWEVPIEDMPQLQASTIQLRDEAELDRALEQALATLAPDRRVVVRMHLEGRHRDEIAALLGWSEARTRNLMYRGLDDLKRALQRAHAEGGHA